MKSISIRYYLQSDEKSFRYIHSKSGKPLSVSIENDSSAKFSGKFYANEMNLKNWWIEKETVKTIRNVERVS